MQSPEGLKIKEVPKANEFGKETQLKKAWTSFSDLLRDIGTASTLASDQFDRQSPLMNAARGFVNVGLGSGMEVAMDSLWDNVWKGKKTFIDRFEFGPGLAEKMNEFVLDNPENARLAYFIKESAQDVSMSVIYNMIMTFRAQNLFPKVEPKHLMESLAVNAAEAAFSPKLPEDMRKQAVASQNAMYEEKNRDIRKNVRDLENDYDRARRRGMEVTNKKVMTQGGYTVERGGERQYNVPAKYMNVRVEKQKNPEELQAISDQMSRLQDGILSQLPAAEYHPGTYEKFFRSIIRYSNPITDLGITMVGESLFKFKENFDLIRKIRKEKGGLAGKKVFIPKNDYRGSKSEHRGKDAVYYGKAKWQQKQAEPVAEEIYEKFD